MAFADPDDRTSGPDQNSLIFNAQPGVFGAGGVKSAARPERWRDTPLVQADQGHRRTACEKWYFFKYYHNFMFLGLILGFPSTAGARRSTETGILQTTTRMSLSGAQSRVPTFRIRFRNY